VVPWDVLFQVKGFLKNPEALRGFDSPLVFNQGVKASLAEVADQEVPGKLQ
jgi:hypothetical protein